MRKLLGALGKPLRWFANAPLWAAMLTIAATALVLNMFLDIACRGSLIGTLAFALKNPIAFLAGVFIILTTLSLCLLLRRRLALFSTVCLLWVTIGIISLVVMSIRSAPLSGIDFLVMKDALSVASAYFRVFEIVLIAVGIVLALALIVFLFIKAPKSRVSYLFSAISVVSTAAVCLGLFFLVSAMSPKSEELISAYNRNGFVYCFTESIFVHGVERPDDEAINKKDELMDKLAGTAGSEVTTELPNIVVVQLESFFDINQVKDLEFTAAPTPNYTALKENNISGYLNVAHVGGGTANIEFEFLTGMNLDHFGLAEFPYTTVLKDRACESLATNLNSLGYTSHALHNHIATFYGRNVVYPSLGFNTFTPVEMMTNIERNILTFCTDDVLVGEIESALNSTTTQDFVFAVSVEGHGGYPDYNLEGYYTENDIDVSGLEDEKAYHQYRFYLKLIREMDETVGEICKLMEERGEPYVLVFYGDHLPSLPITPEQLESGSIYKTEYVIVSNVNFPGAKDASALNELDFDLETYQLAAYIQKLCGLSEGDITRLHQHEFETGEMYDDILQTLEYEQLYAEEEIYEPADMTIGTRPVIFDRYELYGETLYIFGSGFNHYSKVEVNGIKRGTTYIDENTLAIENIENINSIKVLQLADDGTELAESVPAE